MPRLIEHLGRAATVTFREARRDGVGRTVRRAVRTAHLYGLRNAVQRAETAGGVWNWYRLDLSGNEPRPLPAGMELRRCDEADIPLYAEIEPAASRDSKRRMDADGTLWLVISDGRALFAAWTFPTRVPVGQAAGGWLELPAGTAQLKDIVTAEAARGRGIATAAISLIADAVAAEGFTYFIGRIEDSNFTSRHVYTKLGFVVLGADDPMRLDFAGQGV